jgi:transcriptional regulator with XRE-family HTH domain
MTTVLRRERQIRDLSQEELADMLGVARTSVTAYELGRHRPRKHVKHKLTAIFGRPYLELLEPDNANEAVAPSATTS